MSAAGTTVDAEPGPGRGRGRRDDCGANLTALTPDEACAIFMLSTPAPLPEVGVRLALRSARAAALAPGLARAPEARRSPAGPALAAGSPGGSTSPSLEAARAVVLSRAREVLALRLSVRDSAEQIANL
ncbi:MAG: hypothetical protein IT318_06890 [Anaerolineales bacterium]|nr:hypothetical protein [Anaerolineales bacterium]